MRFPLRLAAELYRREVLRFLTGAAGAPRIFRYSPLDTHFPDTYRPDESPDLEWHTPRECVHAAEQVRAQVIWLGGAEPLLHPEIGRVVAALVESGRQVFLHTSGVDLRKRIHEFRPDSRLFLAQECTPGENLRDPQAGQARLSQAVEAIRAARLSGFYVCGHLTVDAAVGTAAFRSLLDALRPHGLDGFVVSSGDALRHGSRGTEMEEQLCRVRALIESLGWRRFSHLLEESGAAQRREVAKVHASEVGAYEESA